ncbi:oxidoreductase [Streptomyces sp. WELS2]|uniref:NADH-quinone oxidoreductase subunit B family protein n=1 Tax=Streptomyces sp. WELS2 TaxID=2749435 RepID=UPI002867B867|nr:oxidoreductase [Streptomyces sp. WELS2]
MTTDDRDPRLPAGRRPTLAVWKFASCDGCQLTLLDCEDELLPLAGQLEVSYFLEATSTAGPGPYDLSLVDGSITTPRDAARIQHIRAVSRHLVTIGACATAGGIQALRNFADVAEYRAVVYASPEYIDTLDESTAIALNVPVDFELRGCPIDRGQLLEVITAFLTGRRPDIPDHSVCFPCKRRGTVCLPVAKGVPCLGPVTHDGCGALCPSYGRGCYGCFGPSASTNLPAFVPLLRRDGMTDTDVVRVLRTFNAAAPEFAEASTALEHPGRDTVERPEEER